MRPGATSIRCLLVVAAALAVSPATASDEPPALGPGEPEARAAAAERPPQTDLLDTDAVARQVARAFLSSAAWYSRTPPGERMTWGGLVACAALGLVVSVGRLFSLRRRRIIPVKFAARFLDRLNEGKLDGGKALDYCEMNPSPAARVALAAVRRWGRPAADLERAVALAHRVEADRLRRNVGTLRRITALAPLLGLLGSLMAAGRSLETLPPDGAKVAWSQALASALTPLTLGVAIATLALVAYDALSVRIERLAGALDRLGAETIDAVAMARPAAAPLLSVDPGGPRTIEPHAGHLGAQGAHRAPYQAPPERRRASEPARRSPAADHEIGF